MTDLSGPRETDVCCQCGGSLENGYQARFAPEREPDTGYRDEEFWCRDCADAEGQYEAADTAYDAGVEDKV